MKRIKLKEQDIHRMVKRVLNEGYGYDEYIPNIKVGDNFRDNFNGDIFTITNVRNNNPDGEGMDWETWIELENKGGEVISFPEDYDRGAKFNDLFTKVYYKRKYDYPSFDDIQLNEENQTKERAGGDSDNSAGQDKEEWKDRLHQKLWMAIEDIDEERETQAAIKLNNEDVIDVLLSIVNSLDDYIIDSLHADFIPGEEKGYVDYDGEPLVQPPFDDED